MNRKQEVGLWVVGVTLAVISAANGHEAEDWIFSQFVPVVIIGTLGILAMRSRSEKMQSERKSISDVLRGGGVVLLIASGTGYLRHAASAAKAEADSVSVSTWLLESRVEDLNSRLDSLALGQEEGQEREVSQLQAQVGELESDLSSLRFEVGELESDISRLRLEVLP